MSRLKYSIAVFIISIQALSAQNNPDAERLITNLLNSVKTEAIRTNFRLNVFEKNAVNSQSGSGTFTLKGIKFALEMDGMKAWFDGKTQWAYVAKSNEVSVTEPGEQELSETNPMAVLSGYKTKCNIQFSNTKSAKNYVINMIPKTKSEILKIEVQIAKSGNTPYSIKLWNKNGSTTLLTLLNFQKEVKVSDDQFVFNKTKFKGVVVNDLR